jgi:hypothetical protein
MREWHKAVLGSESFAGLSPAKVTLPLQMELVRFDSVDGLIIKLLVTMYIWECPERKE